MKYLVLIAFLFACERRPRVDHELDRQNGFNEICLAGVVYWYKNIYQESALAPKFSKDGSIVRCK